jgi:bifunctional enzyme CysN/CysC
MEAANTRDRMDVVFVGHVDHGKSTVVGRLLADTGSLPEGKIDQVRRNCELNSRPFEYAFLIDSLKDEQSQGITIDSARIFFKSKKRDYVIIDAPGHIEFLRNMVTGASRAQAALLVIDAREGVRENSKRHGYLLAMLGIREIAVLVNKIDLVGFDEHVFKSIKTEYEKFLGDINIRPACCMPVSGLLGHNITPEGERMPWYSGPSVLDVLDSFTSEGPLDGLPFRMPVQDVYKFTRYGDDRRIVAGTIDTGKISVGDEVIFYPSGKRSRVRTIERFNSPVLTEAVASMAAGLTLEEQIYITRYELAARAGEHQPMVSSRFKASVFWLGKNPLEQRREYFIKIGAAKIRARLVEVRRVIDASNLAVRESAGHIGRNDVAECVFATSRAMAFDRAETNPFTSRFVIVDDYEIAGGGIIISEEADDAAWVRDKVFVRNFKWEKSEIEFRTRSERYNQKPALVLITGGREIGKKRIARALEKRLFLAGKIVYFLGIGNILYGVDADIKGRGESDRREEHIRRLAEVSHLMLDAGIILIVTAVDLRYSDMEIITATVDPDIILTVWVGDNQGAFVSDCSIESPENISEGVEMLVEELQRRGIIFGLW